jgi:hypothetical protein
MKALIILLALAQSAALAAERPEDFAYGISIEAGARDALYEFEIPLAVYRGVTGAISATCGFLTDKKRRCRTR